MKNYWSKSWLTNLRYCLFFSLIALQANAGLEVGPGKAHSSIAEAIEKAQPHDTVTVFEGIYHEHSLVIEKPLHLRAYGKAVLDAENQKVPMIIIESDSVIVEGFTLQNMGHSYTQDLAAIKVKRAGHGAIRNNQLFNTFFGIYLAYAHDYQVTANLIRGKGGNEASAGNAIHIWKGDSVAVEGNDLSQHRDGIYFEFVNHSTITGNKSYDNIRYGLHFMFSSHDVYHYNEFRNNGAGVAVMFSEVIEMRYNHFSQNWGGSSYGLLLKEINRGKINNNYFYRNTIGIMGEGASDLEIAKNTFRSNGKAMEIQGNCIDNRILANDFMGNTFEVITNSRYSTNHYEGNYWSQYSGYDLNHDGIGDVPYRPVNLFAKVTDKIPAATILLHSFVSNVMEMSERLFPSIIAEELIDLKPRMKPYHYDHDRN